MDFMSKKEVRRKKKFKSRIKPWKLKDDELGLLLRLKLRLHALEMKDRMT